MFTNISNFLLSHGFNESLAEYLGWIAIIIVVVLFAIVANYIAKKILLNIISRLIRKSKTRLDDYFLEHKVFARLSHIAPALVFAGMANAFPPDIESYIIRFSTIYLIFVGYLVLSSFLNAIVDLYRTTEASRQKPIKGYAQIIKVIVFVFVSIYAVGIILNQAVWPILTGLGAMTAIILLVFKDSILGLVSSIQISANDMVRIGDWIEMPKYSADGDVIDITLTTVKVQNWDKTISYIPAYALISDSFKNWRGMSDSGGRRIKRAISIDMNSIRLANENDLEKWRKFEHIQDYLETKQNELTTYNAETKVDLSEMINGRRLTNIGTFRAYCLAYLKNHPKVHQEMTLLVRHLQPTESGLPVELYLFSNDQVWDNYESIQADIFDHLLAVIPEFGLRVFQNPSGADFRSIIK